MKKVIYILIFFVLYAFADNRVLNLSEFKEKIIQSEHISKQLPNIKITATSEEKSKRVAYSPIEQDIKKMIGNMLFVGFYGEKVTPKSKIIRLINKYHIAGVILFDKDPRNRAKAKNIANPKQLQKLTKELQALTKHHLWIAVDQEGGLVSRLKKSNGFIDTPKADTIGKKDDANYTKSVYNKLAEELANNGINCDFGPVVDLAINPKNSVIVRYGRSYGRSDKKVIRHAEIFIDELRKKNILCVLKHFPGHGSSLKDSHKGFVDISKTWSPKELKPYIRLIENGKVDMIMTAHVYNDKLDKKYPATLSYEVNTKLLRNSLGYRGVIITDDLQMKAISKHYSLEETVTLAINSGVDILLFTNQLDKEVDVERLINTIYKLVEKKKIPLQKIVNANCRINNLVRKYTHTR